MSDTTKGSHETPQGCVLDVGYQDNDEDRTDLDQVIEKAVGRDCTDSGYCLDIRDMQWHHMMFNLDDYLPLIQAVVSPERLAYVTIYPEGDRDHPVIDFKADWYAKLNISGGF